MIGRSSKFFFAFYNICMKSQKTCQLIVVQNLTFYQSWAPTPKDE